MPPTLFLIAPTLSLLAGQAAAEYLEMSFVMWGALVATAAALISCRWDPRAGLLLVLCCAAFVWGHQAYARLLDPSLPDHHIARLPAASAPVWTEGRLYREPEQRGDKTRWYLRVQRLEREDGVVPAAGNVVVTLGRAYREWRYGDRVRLPLRLRVPRNRTSFDYAAYLARREIYRTAYLHNDWQVRLLSRDTSTGWAWIEDMRRRVRRFIYRYLSPPAAPLLDALVLGDRGRLPPALTGSFTAVGMAHVLSISGLHVGMLSLCAFFVLRRLLSLSNWLLLRWPMFKLASLASVLPVLLYAALAGGRIPTVRAAIMISVYQLAVLVDRDEETLASLALAALLVGLVWPGAVMEPSFQLSFLAVLAIVWGLRILGRRETGAARPMPPGRLRALWNGAVLGTIVPLLATAGTGPLIVYHFGYLSLSGLFANPLLVPLVGFVLVPLGLLTGALSLFCAPLAVWLACVLEPLLSFLAFAVDGLAALPMSAVHLPKPHLWAVAGLYALLLALACCARNARR